MEEKMLEECALYFRRNKAYTRMFTEMKKKYIKYGRLTGQILLKNLSEAECSALAYLSRGDGNGNKNVRLAVLGAEITKNPHYFDRQNAAGRLLLSALSFIYRVEEPKVQEDVLALYYMAGIMPDDISSYTTCYGIHFYEGDSEHEAYRYFIEKGEKYVLTLSNLSRLTRADSSRKKVFIIENQMVFSQVCDEIGGEEYSVVCTSGQLRTASLFLIDLLLKSGCKLYYCGDIDPEGIEIADRVLARGSGQIFPWRMMTEDYYRSISDEILTERRLKRLDKITNVQLRELAEILKVEKKAGYQEHLIGLMLEDIKAIK